jgi:hypothetical protein
MLNIEHLKVVVAMLQSNKDIVLEKLLQEVEQLFEEQMDPGPRPLHHLHLSMVRDESGLRFHRMCNVGFVALNS